MIKRIDNPDPKSLIMTDPHLTAYLSKFESEINRGISTLCILSIIKNSNSGGIHGYKILKELSNKTNDLLVIEEGTLYPLLRKIEKEGLIESKRVEVDGRLRKNYSITKDGVKVSNRMEGFYSKLTEAISPLFDVNVDLGQGYFYCPDCANKIDLTIDGLNFCDICGKNIEDLKYRRLE